MKLFFSGSLATALLLLIGRHDVSGTLVDLFVRTTYVEQDEEGNLMRKSCANCTTSSADSDGSCLFLRSLVPAGQCHSSSRGYRIWRWQEDDNAATMGGSICEDRFSDSECRNLTSTCGNQGWTVDSCDASINGLSTVYTRLKDFCLSSDVVDGRFTFPLVTEQAFLDGKEACENNVMSREVIQGWRVSASNLCWKASVTAAGPPSASRVLGSERIACQDDASVKVDVFSDPQCSEQADVLNTTKRVIGSRCTESSDGQSYSKVLDCQSPSLFCKNLATTEFATAINVASGNTNGEDDDDEDDDDDDENEDENGEDDDEIEDSAQSFSASGSGLVVMLSGAILFGWIV